MSNGKRAYRGLGGHAGFRAKEASRYFIALIIALLSFSCSHSSKTKIKKNESAPFVRVPPWQPLKNSCLSAEGRGRLETPQGRYVFSFESVLKKKEQVWSLAANIPTRGEEVLHLHYAAGKGKGSFIRLMGQRMRNPLEGKRFLKSLTYFIALVHPEIREKWACEESKSGWTCIHDSRKKLSIETDKDRSSYQFYSKSGVKTLQVVLSHLSDNAFSRMALIWHPYSDNTGLPAQMKFYNSSCQ